MISLLFALLLGADPPRGGAASDARLNAALAATRVNDCARALAELRPLLQAGVAERLGDPAAGTILSIGALCEQKRIDAAYPYVMRATRFANVPDDVWGMRLEIEIARGNHAEAVATIEAMAAGRGAALNQVEPRWLWSLHASLKSKGLDAARARFLKVLAETYDPDPLQGNSDKFRQLYAVQLHESGDADGARKVLEGIQSPAVLLSIMVDRSLRKALPADFDLRAATEHALERDQWLMAARPDQLKPVLSVSRDLRWLGRPSEALLLLESIRSRVETKSYGDDAASRSWWWDELSRVYRALGQRGDAVASLRSGMMTTENGHKNVSQTINLAQLLNNLEEPDEALAVLNADGGIGEASPYGTMQIRHVYGCAYSQLGRIAEALAERRYVVAHKVDSATTPLEFFICAKEYDAAAAEVVSLLNDPEQRAAILLEFSTYENAPIEAVATAYAKGLRILSTRPDVKAALDASGGIVRFPIQRAG